jgi:hypothetical protein
MFPNPRTLTAAGPIIAGILSCLCGPILPPCVRVCKPKPSSWGLLGAEVGGDSMLRATNFVFAFIRTHLSYGFRSNA